MLPESTGKPFGLMRRITRCILKWENHSRYIVTGLNGMDTRADVTHSQYLTIVSSDPKILDVDKENARFIVEQDC